MTKLIPIDDFFIHLSLIIVTELNKCSFLIGESGCLVLRSALQRLGCPSGQITTAGAGTGCKRARCRVLVGRGRKARAMRLTVAPGGLRGHEIENNLEAAEFMGVVRIAHVLTNQRKPECLITVPMPQVVQRPLTAAFSLLCTGLWRCHTRVSNLRA